MARNNDDGTFQEQPNDNGVEELRIDMTLMKEQMAGMAKMIENMTILMQASVATTPPVSGTERQKIPVEEVPSNSVPGGMLAGQGVTTHIMDTSACSNGPMVGIVERP